MELWLAQHFFNPTFIVAGTALVAAPILIHLINRMRYRRVQFAAMEFLLASEQRNRRRVLFEQLLLLLLRILIVLAIVALLARLILDPNQMSIFRGAKAHHVVLLDDSASMRNRWGETTAFAEAVDVVQKLAAEGARRPDTQRFSLILLSNPEQPFLPDRDVNDAFVSELSTKLENLGSTHQALDLVAGLDAAHKFLESERGTIRHLHVVSDFRRRDWDDQAALSAAMAALTDAGITVNLVRTVPERHANLAVTELTGAVQVAAAGVPLRLRVGVKNYGDQVASNVRLGVFDDGVKIPASIVFDRIEAGVEAFHEFDVRLATAGVHQLHVGLEGDALPEDNTRYLAVAVAGNIPVLIIDGNPAGTDAAYIADALAADPQNTGIAITSGESIEYLAQRPLDGFSSIYLLNVPELRADALAQLRDYVSRGGGLAWFVGDTVRPAFYNETLYDDGRGLFPVRLGPAPRNLPRDSSTNPGPDLVVGAHPLFAILQGQENPFIDGVRISRYFPVAEDWIADDQQRGDSVRTIAALRNKAPLMFVHSYGKGRVLTSLTTAGPAWNNWSVNPSYVVLQLDLQKELARNDRALERRLAGEPITLQLDPAVYTEQVEIRSPDATGTRITRLQAAPETPAASAESGSAPTSDSAALRLATSFRDTDQPGIYAVRLVDQNQMTEERFLAYNVPTSESELELADSAQILKRLGDATTVRIQEAGRFEWIQGEDAGQEIRMALLVLLFVFLLLEQAMAYRLSYHPKLAGATA